MGSKRKRRGQRSNKANVATTNAPSGGVTGTQSITSKVQGAFPNANLKSGSKPKPRKRGRRRGLFGRIGRGVRGLTKGISKGVRGVTKGVSNIAKGATKGIRGVAKGVGKATRGIAKGVLGKKGLLGGALGIVGKVAKGASKTTRGILGGIGSVLKGGKRPSTKTNTKPTPPTTTKPNPPPKPVGPTFAKSSKRDWSKNEFVNPTKNTLGNMSVRGGTRRRQTLGTSTKLAMGNKSRRRKRNNSDFENNDRLA